MFELFKLLELSHLSCNELFRLFENYSFTLGKKKKRERERGSWLSKDFERVPPYRDSSRFYV